MIHYPTPHIAAAPKDFAKTVLMPGDPLRAKFIAETFLDSAKLVNNVRGIQGYTGEFDGVPVSVMASGMGMPSIGIYAHELYHAFGVENIIRIGSAGSMQESVRLRDIVIGMGASTNSNFAHQYHLPGTFAPTCSYDLLKPCVDIADAMGVRYHVGNLLSTDAFYGDEEGLPECLQYLPSWNKMGTLAVEMEAAALYMTAARAGKRALAICTVSDNLITGEALSAADRQESFAEMIQLALHTVKEMAK